MFLSMVVITVTDEWVVENAAEVGLKVNGDKGWRVVQKRILERGEAHRFGPR